MCPIFLFLFLFFFSCKTLAARFGCHCNRPISQSPKSLNKQRARFWCLNVNHFFRGDTTISGDPDAASKGTIDGYDLFDKMKDKQFYSTEIPDRRGGFNKNYNSSSAVEVSV